MNYFSQSTLIQKISQKIIEPKQTNYNEQPILYALNYLYHYEHVDSAVYNKYQEKLKVSLFFCKDQPCQNCVVYMHGYGSNRIEGIFLLRHLPRNIGLCCFDFSAEGKSQGSVVTFGQKEKDDINVILQILDSPFISFAEAALELTKKRIAIPEVLLKITLQALGKNLSNKEYNPFQIDLNKPIPCQIPTVFVYSQNDEVISPQNSLRIINNFQGYYQKIVIKQLHNVLRKNQTIRDLITIIKKKLIRQHHKTRSSVQTQYVCRTQIKRTLEKKGSLENYGIWVTSKLISSQDRSEQSYGTQKTQPQISSDKRTKSSIKVYSSLKNMPNDPPEDQTQAEPPKIHRLSSPKQKKTHKKVFNL